MLQRIDLSANMSSAGTCLVKAMGIRRDSTGEQEEGIYYASSPAGSCWMTGGAAAFLLSGLQFNDYHQVGKRQSID